MIVWVWVRSHLLPGVMGLLGLGALFVILRLVDLNAQLALLITLMMAAVLLAMACLDIGHEWVFQRSLANVARARDKGDDVLAALSMVESPNSPQGELVFDALEAVATTAANEVTTLRCQANDHRDFVEAWVHEIKTPLAAADLIIENLADDRLRPVSTELDRIDGYVEQALFYLSLIHI